jgi:glycoside/pentoside/hexuronide:cation symporter, GPH family
MSTSNAARLSMTEKVGYSFADFAAQFVFLTMVNYQAAFYTDAVGISPSHASWLVLIARLWDAFFDPMMGFIADRTKSRWGRFRPWILWSIIPWAVCMVAAYTVPSFRAYWATYLYALITNIALMTIYSMNNTPYSALMAVMTGDQKQRTNLSQYRFIAAMIGQLIVGGFTLVIMNSLGGHLPLPPAEQAQTQLTAMTQAATSTTLPFQIAPDVAAKPPDTLTLADTPVMREYRELKHTHDSQGWQRTMMVFAGVCSVCFLLTFLTTKERLAPIEKKRSPIRKDISILLTNGPWMVMFLVTITHYILSGIRGSAYAYYVNYLLDPGAMKHFISQWGIPASDGYDTFATWMPEFLRSGSFFLLSKFKLVLQPDGSNVPAVTYGLLQMTNKLWNVVGIIAASALVVRFSKKVVVSVSLIANTVFIIALYWVPFKNIWGVYIVEWLGQLAYAPTVPLLWVLFADVCDYTEWKTGRSITGFIYATFFFALKAGISLGAFLGLQVMSFFGYEANAVQTDRSKLGILLTLTLIPGIFSVGCALSMLLYQITRKMNHQIADELTARRATARQDA